MSTPDPSFAADGQSHFHFVTGRLAEAALREVVGRHARATGMRYSIGVMPITVAALMTPKWLLRHLVVPGEATTVVLPGYLADHQAEIEQSLGVPVLCGPRDLRQLPEFFGGAATRDEVMREHDIRIIAEINHAPRLSIDELVSTAKRLLGEGADIIDIGCDPSSRWTDIADAFRRLTDEQIPTSVDTFDPWEAQRACRHGASLVLSVNRSNREAAADWGAEVVAIPDTPDDLASLDVTIEYLARRGVAMRLDPILEPIGMGFMQSLLRYVETRRRYPETEMMMGIGNLTELTDVDSAGVNLILLAICQELSIRSVLTTQVINWARSSVRECDLARRLVHYSIHHQTPPKRLDDSLVLLRDPKLRPFSQQVLGRLATELRDNNYRIFAQDDQVHLISAGLHLRDDDPFRLFERLMAEPQSENVDPGHAFYLGFEMAKALTALTLGKQYEQDQALRWGHLTRPEIHHRLARKRRRKPVSNDEPAQGGPVARDNAGQGGAEQGGDQP
jgi:dihydropteroate synthase